MAKDLLNMNVGVKVGDRKIPLLMYADDIVLVSEDEQELQAMLNHVHDWCRKWQMCVNMDKTNLYTLEKRTNQDLHMILNMVHKR